MVASASAEERKFLLIVRDKGKWKEFISKDKEPPVREGQDFLQLREHRCHAEKAIVPSVVTCCNPRKKEGFGEFKVTLSLLSSWPRDSQSVGSDSFQVK